SDYLHKRMIVYAAAGFNRCRNTRVGVVANGYDSVVIHRLISRLHGLINPLFIRAPHRHNPLEKRHQPGMSGYDSQQMGKLQMTVYINKTGYDNSFVPLYFPALKPRIARPVKTDDDPIVAYFDHTVFNSSISNRNNIICRKKSVHSTQGFPLLRKLCSKHLMDTTDSI